MNVARGLSSNNGRIYCHSKNAMSGCGRRIASDGCQTGNGTACYQSTAILDWKWYSQFNALLNMLRTLFICAILAIGVFVFNRDASKLVLQPIERMLKKVKDVSENPLAIKQVCALS